MSLAVGTDAPDFELIGTPSEPYRLSNLRGQKNAVVAFYELAFNNDCTDEMLAFQDLLPDFEAADTEIVAISLDPKGILDSFAGSNGLEFSLLSDTFQHDTCHAYEAWRTDRGFASETGGMAKRVTYVVDKQGKVGGVVEDVSDVTEHASKALDIVKGLK